MIRRALPRVEGLPEGVYVAKVEEEGPPNPFIAIDTGLYESCKWLNAYHRGALRVGKMNNNPDKLAENLTRKSQ